MSTMKIQVVNVDVQEGKTKTNKPYEFLDVMYKNLSFDNKAEAKKIMPFGSKEVFATLKSAQKGDVFTIVREKDDAGYWQWISILEGDQEVETAKPAGAGAATKAATAPRSNFETPEERAQRQILIVRQSCLSNAVEYLNHNKKNYTQDDLFAVASNFFSWVFEQPVAAKTAELPALEEDDDIPL